MPTSRQLPVPTQVKRESKAATPGAAPRLICLDPLAGIEIPHMDASVARRAGQEVLVGTQRNRPYVAAARLGRRHLPPQLPGAPVVALASPDLDLAAEANARGDVASSVACGCDMVAAELVGSFELLLEGEGGLDGAVDADGRGAAGGEEGCGRRSEGEYLGRMGCSGLVLATGIGREATRQGRQGSSNLGPPCGR